MMRKIRTRKSGGALTVVFSQPTINVPRIHADTRRITIPALFISSRPFSCGVVYCCVIVAEEDKPDESVIERLKTVALAMMIFISFPTSSGEMHQAVAGLDRHSNFRSTSSLVTGFIR